MNNKIDKELLIELVRNEPRLWDQRNKYYHNRDIKYELWDNISKELDVTATLARKTWHNLRDTYRRKLKANSETRSGQMAPVNEKWIYYNSLTFLNDNMKPRISSSNIPPPIQTLTPNEENIYSTPDIENNYDLETDTNSDIPKLNCQNELNEIKSNKKINSKDIAIDIEKQKCLLLERLVEQITNREIGEDEDVWFLKSMTPYLKQLNPIEKLKQKTKFMNNITTALLEQTNNSHSSSVE